MIELNETQIEEIREHTKHRKDVRQKLTVLRSNRTKFKHASLLLSGEGGQLKMEQGVRGGFLGDMLAALETHLAETDEALTVKLATLGVRVS